MKANKDSVVALVYQLRTEPNGPVMDEATADAPFEFLFGHGNVLDKFESNLEGLIAGNQFSFTLTPADGYGEFDPEAVIKMNKSDFQFEGEDASHRGGQSDPSAGPIRKSIPRPYHSYQRW